MSAFKVEVSDDAMYRIVAPNGEEGLVFEFGDRADIALTTGECWEAYISADGRFDGLVYHTSEPGSLDILDTQTAETIPHAEFIFEDEDETEDGEPELVQ